MKTPADLPSYARARQPKRAVYDREAIYDILDHAIVGMVGFIAEARPMVVPMAYARDGDTLYLHGASKTRIVQMHDDRAPLCMTVTQLDGIVAARSGMHHSVNYRSATVHGDARAVTHYEEHDRALQLITEHILPGRYEEIREMNAQERKATGVLALEIKSASAKVRNGPPVDDDEDYELGLWGGVLPIASGFGRGEPDARTVADGLTEPPSFARARAKFSR